MLIVLNKGIPHWDWLAKYTAAFFKISRSSVTRCNSFRSLASSASEALASVITLGCCGSQRLAALIAAHETPLNMHYWRFFFILGGGMTDKVQAKNT